jgi:hypothetical protein
MYKIKLLNNVSKIPANDKYWFVLGRLLLVVGTDDVISM